MAQQVTLDGDELARGIDERGGGELGHAVDLARGVTDVLGIDEDGDAGHGKGLGSECAAMVRDNRCT